MTTRSAQVFATCCAAAAVIIGSSSGAQTNRSSQRKPEVIAAAVPIFPSEVGAFKTSFKTRIAVRTDGRELTDIRILDKAGFQMVNDASINNLRTWQLAPHSPTTFEVAYTFRFRDNYPCGDRNTHVYAQFPNELVIEGTGDQLCHRSYERVRGLSQIQSVSGTVRCDCAARQVLPLANVSVEGRTGEARQRFDVKADRAGQFAVPGIPPGRYDVRVSLDGFVGRSYSVMVSPTAARTPLQAFLPIDGSFVPPSEPVVTSAMVPTYPAAARAADTEGVVYLQMNSGGVLSEVSTAPPELAKAAKENLRTWKFAESLSRSFNVTFRYRLAPGDCAGDDGPNVAMRFPNEVDITMKRRLPCSALQFGPR